MHRNLRRLVLRLAIFMPLWHGLIAGLDAAEPLEVQKGAATLSADPNDWPTYNRDVIGTRHNPAEKWLSRDNVGQLVEKWRFPPADSTDKIGVVHATVVVNGHVYFGTETKPTF